MRTRIFSIILLLFIFFYKFSLSQSLSPIFPKNGYITSAKSLTLEWNSVYSPHKYHIQVANDSNFTQIFVEEFALDTSVYVLKNLHYNKTYYWRYRALVNAKYTNWSHKLMFKTFNPGAIPSIQLWFASDSGIVKDATNKISQWNDISGNNRNGMQAVDANKAIYKPNNSLINDKPVATFANGHTFGTQSFFDFVPININNGEFTFVVFYKINDITDRGYPADKWQVLFCGNNTGSFYARNHGSNGYSLFTPNNYKFTSNLAYPDFTLCYNDKYNIYINSKKANYIRNDTIKDNLQFSRLGTRIDALPDAQFFSGDVAELMLFNKVLPDSTRTILESYFYQKYTPPVNLGRDMFVNYGFCNTTIDAGKQYKFFEWSTGETTQTISVNKSDVYSVKVWDIFGNTSTDTIILKKTNLNLRDTTMCLNQSAEAEFHTGLDSLEYSFLWSDGSKRSSFIASNAGKYWVKLTDTLGCTFTDTVNIKVDSLAAVISLGADRELCSGDELRLIKGAKKVDLYKWAIDTTLNQSYITIKNSGKYILTVTSKAGCVGIDTVDITVKGIVPVSDFVADTACFGNPTNFKDKSTVGSSFKIDKWQWDFGDNNTDISPNPVHIFGNTGDYNVSLTTTSGGSCHNTIIKSVHVNSIPKVNFSPTNGCSGVNINFFDKTWDNYGNIVRWKWKFNDFSAGNSDTSTLSNPIYKFNNPGIYKIKLIAYSKISCSDSLVKTVNISKTPDIDFSYSNACLGQAVYFKDISNNPVYAPVIYRKWDFGDTINSVSYISNPSHLYDSIKSYNVKLSIQTINGCNAEIIRTVPINPIPKAGFYVKDICMGFPFQCYDTSKTSSGNIIKWSWNIDKIGRSEQQHPYFTLPDTNIYNVKLKVESDALCFDSIFKTIYAHSLPNSGFTYFPEYGTAPLDIKFTNLSKKAISYLWNFGDNTTSNATSPYHQYQNNNIYKVTLTSFNQFNCLDTSSRYLYIMQFIADIGITSVNATIENNYIVFSADLVNVGTKTIKEFEIFANFKNGTPISEKWSGILTPGSVMRYKFISKFRILPEVEPHYLCLNVSIDNDSNLENNRKCFSFHNEFYVFDLYPNPVDNNLFLDFILPYSDVIDITIYDITGRKADSFRLNSCTEGLNQYTINLNNLSSGYYTCKISFNDNNIIKKFIKN